MAKIITTAKARRLLKNYMEKYGIDATNKKENIAVWFPASFLLELLTSALYTDGKIPNGLQIYFGSYSNAQTDKPENTVILVPTYQNGGIITDILQTPEACPDTQVAWHPSFEGNEGQGNPPPDPEQLSAQTGATIKYDLGLARTPEGCND